MGIRLMIYGASILSFYQGHRLPRRKRQAATETGATGKDGSISSTTGGIGLVPAELICGETDGGHFFEGAGEASFSAADGVFEITLPGGGTVYIDTKNGPSE